MNLMVLSPAQLMEIRKYINRVGWQRFGGNYIWISLLSAIVLVDGEIDGAVENNRLTSRLGVSIKIGKALFSACSLSLACFFWLACRRCAFSLSSNGSAASLRY